MEAQTGGVRPYQPDYEFNGLGLFNLAATLLLVGATAGYVAHFISQWFYLVLIFPVLIGLVVGFSGNWMVKKYKVRNPLICGAAGFVAGMFAMIMMHNMDFHQVRNLGNHFEAGEKTFLSLSPEERVETIARQDTEEAKQYLNDLVAYDKATRNLWTWMNDAAQQGVSIGKVGDDGEGGINLGYGGSFIYWGVEILVVAGIVFVMLRKSAGEPFCAVCDDWKAAEFMGSLAGDPGVLHDAVSRGDLSVLAQAEASDRPGRLNLYCIRCSCGQSACEVRVELNEEGKQDAAKVLGTYTYPNELAKDLVQLMTQDGRAAA